MVSKASDDFPEPERPVRTISLLRGRLRSVDLRLCSAAPLMTMASTDMAVGKALPDNARSVRLMRNRDFRAGAAEVSNSPPGVECAGGALKRRRSADRAEAPAAPPRRLPAP